MADDGDQNDEEYVTVEIDNDGLGDKVGKSSTQLGATGTNTDEIEKEEKEKDINWEEDDIVLADKDNKTSKPEYYLRSDVTLQGKIVEDAIEDSTHPYDHQSFFIRWFYKITYANLFFMLHTIFSNCTFSYAYF